MLTSLDVRPSERCAYYYVSTLAPELDTALFFASDSQTITSALQSTVGPLIHKCQANVAACGASHCSGHGRCSRYDSTSPQKSCEAASVALTTEEGGGKVACICDQGWSGAKCSKDVAVSTTLERKPPGRDGTGPGTGPCTLRPGAPAVYAPICAAATTKAACAKVNMTCTWGAPPPPPPRPLSQQYWCNAPYKVCEQCNHYTKPPCTATFRNESRSECEAKCDPGPHPQGYTCLWSGKPGMRCENQFAPFEYPNITSCEAKCKNPPPPPPV